MKPKQYIEKYRLNDTAYFDRNDFIEDILDDFKTTLAAYPKMSPVHFDNCVSNINIKWNNIFIGTKVSEESKDKFWKFFYASSIVAIRNMYYPDWKDAKHQYRMKNDAEYARKYDAYMYHKEMDEHMKQFEREWWDDMLASARARMNDRLNSILNRAASTFNAKVIGARLCMGFTESEEINEPTIKSKYRQLAKMTHPDACNETSEGFIRLKEARDILLEASTMSA